MRSQYDPLRPSRSGGRWDDGSFDVLYTSNSKDGALAESWFHSTAGQPIPPTKGLSRELHEIDASLTNVLSLSLDDLERAGIDREVYGRLSYVRKNAEYPTTQIIGEAAFFFGFEAIIVPNARWPATNTVILTENIRPGQIEVVRTDTINLVDWKQSVRQTGK
ncbi:RES family NAD+ phosphorylase [Erythrobacter sp. SDW2]|nr:RES family NAD+ phosphorylase [Erythrobacter sp. SDW2]UIP08185.1 RES family NAD+ phosphorylase [Erythrobacter sp. SDW2]